MKNFSAALAGATGLALAALAAPAQAAVVQVDTTLDITNFHGASGFNTLQGNPPFSPPFSVQIAEGDTFDFTIDFAGSQTLTLTNTSFAWAFSYTNGESTDVTGTGIFSFLDANGAAFLTSNANTTTESSIHFGQQFNGGDFAGGLPGSLTFYGVRYTGVLEDYVEDGVTSRIYDNPALSFVADSFAVDAGVGAVPEPSAWALMILGFGLAGGAMRSRRKAVRVAHA